MTHLTYFEPLSDGHCSFWAEIILRQAAGDPRIGEVTLVCSPIMAERLNTLCEACGIHVSILSPSQLDAMSQGDLWSRGRSQWVAAKSMMKRTNGHVFLPFFDHAAVAAAADLSLRRGPGSISGIIFRPPNAFGERANLGHMVNALRRWTTYALSRVTLFTLDELAPNSWLGRTSGLLRYVPDPAPDLHMLAALSPRLRADGRCVYLLFGSLTARKGIYQTLDAWAQMDHDFQSRNVLRFVGRLSKDDQAPFIAQLERLRHTHPSAVVELEDRFVDDAELAQEVIDSAVILAPYQNHIGSSGVLYWAAAAGRPTIAQCTELMGYQVSRYGLGVVGDCTNPALIASALAQPAVARIDPTFYATHLPEVFAKTILEGALSQWPG